MKNWLEIAVAVYLLVMVLYGHYRGAIRMAVSVVALAATFVVVHIAMPHVTAFIKNETPVYQWVAEGIEKKLIPEEGLAALETVPGGQDMLEHLNLPKELEELLADHMGEGQMSLNIEALINPIVDYLAETIVSAVGFVVLFVLIYIAVQLLIRWLDLVAKLPVLSGVNKIAGALLGGIQGLFFLYLALLLVTAFSTKPWAQAVVAQIETSVWLSFLYHHNLVSTLVLGLVKGML